MPKLTFRKMEHEVEEKGTFIENSTVNNPDHGHTGASFKRAPEIHLNSHFTHFI
jgi:hypothetical protein